MKNYIITLLRGQERKEETQTLSVSPKRKKAPLVLECRDTYSR